MLWNILYVIFSVAIVTQCAFALYFFLRIFRLPGQNKDPQSEKQVSIIICAKNEGSNLRKNLPLILSQQYENRQGEKNYEVIVVNDGSTDDTADVLKQLEMQYDNLWDIVTVAKNDNEYGGKKSALRKGMEHAANDWLLLTDADCAPASQHWLRQMTAPLAIGKEIVAGYGGYHKENGLRNALIRWETMHTFLQYSAYCLAGLPYMAVGRNLACTKEILQRAMNSDLWNALPYGDDDLLIRTAGNPQNMAIVCSKTSFTVSGASRSIAEWASQKQRHLSTGKYYKPGIKLLLGSYGLSHALTWLAFIVLMASPLCKVALVIMSVRCGLYWLIWRRAAKMLNEESLVTFFPVFDIGWMMYNFAFFPYIAWKNKRQWT